MKPKRPKRPAIETARAAQSRGDWTGALREWSALLERLPDLEEAYIGKADCERETGDFQNADLTIIEANSRFPGRPAIAIGFALNAQYERNWPESLRRWNEVRRHHPDHPYAYAATASVLLEFGRLDEAETLLADAAIKFPTDVTVGVHFANIAAARGDRVAALERWTALQERCAADPYVTANAPGIIAGLLAALGAGDLPALQQAAVDAQGAHSWRAAIRLCQLILQRDPESHFALIRLGIALREAGLCDEADQTLRRAIALYPDNIDNFGNYAQVAAKRADWPEAARRWQATLDKFPDAPAYRGLAGVAFREAGQFAKAGQLFESALQSMPDDIETRMHHARLAEMQDDWPEAARRWELAHRLAPDDPNIRNSRGDAIWHAGLADTDLSVHAKAAKPAARSAGTDISPRELALAFEGLGDNCEFGSIQRRAGAEPIGLFRFAAVHPPVLMQLMDSDFEALGDPDQTYLDPTESGEFLVRDRRGYYQMHSFIKAEAVDAEKFLAQQIRRIHYLKAKLLDDLRAADKIFVYKQSKSAITDAHLIGIQDAMRRFGDNALLGIRLADARHPAGSFDIMRHRLMVGYVDRMYVDGGNIKDLDVDGWFGVMRQAHASRFQTNDNRVAP